MRIQLYHEGKSQRDYTYIDDIVQGILSALEQSSGFQIFNLGNSRTVLLRDLVDLIEKALKRRARVRMMPPQPGDVPITYADISRARAETRFSPQDTDRGRGAEVCEMV